MRRIKTHCRKHKEQKLRGQELCDAKFWAWFTVGEMPTDSESTFGFFFVRKKEQNKKLEC